MNPALRQRLEQEIALRSGHSLLAFLGASDLRVDRVESLDERAYAVFLHLTPETRARFGVTSDQLLAIVLHHPKQQQWFFREARALLSRNDGVSKTALLVFSDDPEIRTLCGAAYPDPTTGYKTAYIGIPLLDIEALAGNLAREQRLFAAFQEQAFSVDHFDTVDPVPDDMFGRTTMLSQLEREVTLGSKAVALLGIRRAGKTSVLKRLVKQVRAIQDDPVLVGEYDAQTHTIDASGERAATEWLRTLKTDAQRVGLDVLEPAGDSAMTRLSSMLRHLVETKGRRVLLTLDEVEWLVPSAAQVGSEEIRTRELDYIRLFGFLRAQKQTFGGRLTTLVCGINESFCERAEIAGHPNPSLDWYARHYVGLLGKSDVGAMLRQVGARMRVELADEFLDLAWGAFAGHPYLARQFCSTVLRTRTSRPTRLVRADFESTYASFIDQAEGVIPRGSPKSGQA